MAEQGRIQAGFGAIPTKAKTIAEPNTPAKQVIRAILSFNLILRYVIKIEWFWQPANVNLFKE
jgi:hypothetical protein